MVTYSKADHINLEEIKYFEVYKDVIVRGFNLKRFGYKPISEEECRVLLMEPKAQSIKEK